MLNVSTKDPQQRRATWEEERPLKYHSHSVKDHIFLANKTFMAHSSCSLGNVPSVDD